MFYLVIDCGTSGCRASLVSETGEIIQQRRQSGALRGLSLLLGETDTEEVWNQVREVTSSILEGVSGGTVEGVGISAMLGYVFLDEESRPLMPATLWMDNRSWREAQELSCRFGHDELYLRTGRRMSPELLAPKLLRVQRQTPEAFRGIHRILGLKDELVRRLTGNCVTDYAHLDYTSLWDVRSGRPLPEVMTALGIGPTLFPEALPAYEIAGCVTSSAAKETGLPEGTPVVVGTSDGTAAMYGGGVLQQGKAVLVSGTTDVLMIASDLYVEDDSRMLTVNRGMFPGIFLVGGAMGLSAGALEWLGNLLHESAEGIEPCIAAVGPGAGGLLFSPGLTGERAPYWREHWSGGVLGLRSWHGPEHIFRALMEGCAMRLGRLVARLRENSLRPRCMHAVGGGAGLGVWNQIRADATDTEVRCPEALEATTLGTAMFCRAATEGVDVLRDLAHNWVKVKKIYAPIPEHVRMYEMLAEAYDLFLEAADPVYQRLRAWTPHGTDSMQSGMSSQGAGS